MAVRDELENQNYQMKKMDGTTAEVDLTVSSWNRATIADGQWLQDKTIAPLSARDVYLADRIDEVSSSVATISEALADAGVTDGTGIAGFKVKSVNRLLDNDGGMSAFEGVPVSIVGTNDSNTVTRDSLTFTTFSKDSENIDGIDEFDGIGGIIQGNTQDDAAVQIAMTPEGVYYRHVNGTTATTAFSDEDDATANYVTDPESFKKLQESLIAGTDLKIENGCVSVNTNGVIETSANVINAFVEGYGTYAGANFAHAEGCMTSAFGSCSHVEGYYTIASGDYQHVFGRYNVKSKTGENFVEIVGNGTYKAPSNARTLDFSGNETLAGDLFFNGTSSLTDSLAAKQDLLEFSYDDNDTITAVNSSAIGGSSIEVFDGTNSGAVPSPETTTASGGKNYFLNAAAEWIVQPIISFTGTNNDGTYVYSQSAYTFQEMSSDGGSVLVVRTNTAVNSEDENAEDCVLATLPTTSVTNTLSSRINSMEETFFPSANFQIDTAYQAVTSVYLDGTYYGLNGAGLTAVAVNSPLSGGGVAESPLGIMMSDDFMSDTNSLTLANIVVSFASSAADLIAPGSSSMKQWISAVVTAINTIARQLDSTN